MAGPASVIALLPTYETAGYVATVALLGLKLVQGFCAGGQLPLTGYFVSLNSSGKNRGLYCAISAASGFLGMLLASETILTVQLIASTLSNQHGIIPAKYVPDPWRWPFIICIPLSILVYKARTSVDGSRELCEDGSPRHRPAMPLLQAFFLVAFMEIVIYSVLVWMPAYLHTYLGVSRTDAGATHSITLLIFSLSMVGIGYFSRFVAPSTLVFIGTALISVSCVPLFFALQNAAFFTLMAVQAVFGVLASCVVGVIFVVLPELFRKNWGSFGMVVTYSVATAVFGGTAPIVCAYLIDASHLLTAPAIYILITGVLATPVAFRLMQQDKAHLPLRAVS
ncbi:MFS transporter [Pandoraea oxalativorans]|uniref:MFS transporter n=2 Tax=Pandoraea oxalativorans TaxID=573737 RepID=A0A0E3YF33_9BURK|nr:MFS transporter [Pandoraea oxalativorans]